MDYKDELLKKSAEREERPIDVKQFLVKLLINWYWFALSAIIGLGAAYVYNQLAPPTYSANSLILIKEKQSDGLDLDNLFDNLQLKTNVKLENHIGVLTSLTLNREVIDNLGWKVSWYRDVAFWNYDLFENPPYQVVTESSDYNIANISLYVTPQGTNKYILKADGIASVNGQKLPVEFEQEGTFGKKFKNDYFSFTINKKGEIQDETFFFRFNDPDELALFYKNHIDVASVNKDADLISLTLKGQSPLKLTQYLNELTNEYVKFGLDEKNQTTENTIRFIDQQLADIVDTLKVTGNNFSDYRAKNRVFDLGQKASLIVEKLVQLESQKSLLKMQINYYENLNNYLDNSERLKKMIAPSVVGITDSGLNNLVAKLIELYSKKETLSYSLEDLNPGIQVVDREVEYTKRSLAENVNNLIFNVKQDLKSLQSEIDDMNAMLVKYPKTEQDLINIRRMFDLNNDLYTFLLQKRAEAEITKVSNIPDVKIVDKAAKITLIKTSPKDKLNYVVGLFFGLLIPFVIVTVRDYFDETVHSSEDIKRLTDIPVVGNIVHNSLTETAPIVKHPKSSLAESLRDLRTNVEYMNFSKYPSVIGVHSVIPGEGKSFLSLNLSTIFAMNNKKVILVGADMRKPTLHNLLNISNKEGLSTFLIGHHLLEEVVKPTSIKNLDFIPAGPVPPNPVELLSTDVFAKLLEVLRTKYDVIVFDNSPLKLVTDARIVGRYTDIDLYVMRQNYSLRESVEHIKQIKDGESKKNVGIVINDVNPKISGYSYGSKGYFRKGYGYGYGHGYYTDENNVASE